MTILPKAGRVLPAGTWQGAADVVALDYEGRFLRRKRLETAGGIAFLVDLPEVTNLTGGEAFALDDGRLIEVRPGLEPVLSVTGDLVRLAWHIGNRHTPCQIEPARLVIRQDHVLKAMLEQLGARVRETIEPFRPEGGAYGMGRTMGHDHGGHDHGGHDLAGHGHSHGPGHFHVHP
ncbi:urease accessory protein UreE [Paenirhodobacter populi]|uniref:urease accessory protein UreE n=1 Tax=Paenirhodobacter populi TaxID=2306993 RepID=UPI000FE40A7C|nr:urease accessory protein UreE [Sinirhodobacter populi]RWR10863.1 urease accessory protein UreE [Sinirhodobacter populi]